MILKYPTGFYRQTLSTFVFQTNITFNISNNSPPRSSINFQKIPDGVAYKLSSGKISNRADVGKLVYTVTNGSTTQVLSDQPTKKIGDYLEFTDLPETTATGVMPETVNDISHDLSYFDFSKMGLSTSEMNLIQSELFVEFNNKTEIVNQLKTDISDLSTQIANLQKQLNDINSSIAALLLTNSPALAPIIARLELQSASISIQISSLYEEFTSKSATLTIESNNLRSLGALIK